MALAFMYHNVVATGAERDAFHPAHRPYVLTRGEFTAHIDRALALGWRFLRADDLYTEAVREGKALLLTFDDSWENHSAAQAMEEKGVRGIFFLNSGEIGWDGRLSKEAVARMAAAGHEIGSHSVKHEFLTNLGTDELRRKLAESRKTLEDISGRPVRFLSAPGGRYDSRVARVAKEAGYEAFFVSWPGFLARVGDAFVLKRMSVSASVSADRMAQMLGSPVLLVLRRKAKYRLMRLMQQFSRKHGGEGH